MFSGHSRTILQELVIEVATSIHSAKILKCANVLNNVVNMLPKEGVHVFTVPLLFNHKL